MDNKINMSREELDQLRKQADIKPGDVVEHVKFGQGTVIEIKGSVLTVIFKSCGTKKLAKDLAPMKKV